MFSCHRGISNTPYLSFQSLWGTIKVRTDATHFAWNTNDYNFKNKNEWVNRNIGICECFSQTSIRKGIVVDVVVVARVGPFKYLGILTRDGTTAVCRQQGTALLCWGREFWQFINTQQNFILECVFASQHSRIVSLSI